MTNEEAAWNGLMTAKETYRAEAHRLARELDRITAERDALKVHLDAAKKETVKWMEVAEEWHKAALAVSDAEKKGGT